MPGVRLVRLVCVVFLGVGLCLGLGCASKTLTLNHVTSNVYSVEGFPAVTVSDDYKLIECRKSDRSGLKSVQCYFLNKKVGHHGGSILLSLGSSLETRYEYYFNTSRMHTDRTIEFKRHTYILRGDGFDATLNEYENPGPQGVAQQEIIALLEILDSNRMQIFLFHVDTDVLPQEPRDDAATLELMLGLMDQAIVSIEP